MLLLPCWRCLHMAPLCVTTASATASFSSSSSKLPPLSFLSSSISCTPSRPPFHPLSTVLRPARCRAAAPGPPPPPRTDPPPGKLQDLAASLSKIQDRVQIFFAVLFWMSLFFWASAWDRRNRPDKGSRFRR